MGPRGAGASVSKKGDPQLRPISVRFSDPTRAAVLAYATERALPVSHAVEQLVTLALAHQTTEAQNEGAAPALAAQITQAVRAGLAGGMADLAGRVERITVDAASSRLMTYALIAYSYGEAEARRAEEATLRVASKAAARGEAASLPPGICR